MAHSSGLIAQGKISGLPTANFRRYSVLGLCQLLRTDVLFTLLHVVVIGILSYLLDGVVMKMNGKSGTVGQVLLLLD